MAGFKPVQAGRKAALGMVVGGLRPGRFEKPGEGGLQLGCRVAGAVGGIEEAPVVGEAA